MDIRQLAARFDPATGELAGAPLQTRRLSDLRGCFADAAAYAAALAAGDVVVYSVAAFTPADTDGDLHCAIGRLLPGRIGDEYFLTKGHLHRWRAAAEIYVGLSGQGVMLLEDEGGGDSRMLPLLPHGIVYVPGHCAHRTLNTGREPLTYLGIYPAKAGHDYAAIAHGNFRSVVVERHGQPTLMPRSTKP